MTIDIEQERKAFEDRYRIPSNVVWCGKQYAPNIDTSNYNTHIFYNSMWRVWQDRAEKDAARIAELEAKLAAIEAQEPVGGIVEVRAENTDWQRYAIYDKYDQALRTAHIIDGKPLVEARAIPLYSAPPLRELTDEDIFKLDERFGNCVELSPFYTAYTKTELLGFARAIERFLKGGE